MKKILFLILLSNSLKCFAFDASRSCQETVPLENSISYYSEKASKFVLATDTCMKEAFEALGMVPKEKPAEVSYANLFVQMTNLSSYTYVYSKELRMFGTASSFMQEGKFLTEDLGFESVTSETPPAETSTDEKLKWRFRVCDLSNRDRPNNIVSCLLVPAHILPMISY